MSVDRNTKIRRQQQRHHVINYEQEVSQSSSINHRREPPLEISNFSYPTAISVSDEVARIKSEEFDHSVSSLMGSTPFCRLCLNDKHKILQYQQIRNTTEFIRQQNRNFQRRRAGTNSESIKKKGRATKNNLTAAERSPATLSPSTAHHRLSTSTRKNSNNVKNNRVRSESSPKAETNLKIGKLRFN